ncbi:MAG: hypothetical protein ABMA64_08430 [Myxococcota bacterium]
MSFPLTVGDRVVADPPALAALVRSDCGAASGTVVPGARPAAWVMALVREGRFERRLAIGLAAALIQNPEASTIGEGARLTAALADRVLGPLVVRGLDGHDTALLLEADPGGHGRSVEDSLLAAATAVCDLTDAAVRGPLLERLRNAGLRDLEIPTLLRHGDLDELRRWLPAVLTEAVGDENLVWITAALSEPGERADIVRAALAAAG